MPLYKFKCPICSRIEVIKLSMKERDELALTCTNTLCSNGIMSRIITSISEPTVMETGSQYHGKQVRRNIQSILKKRSRDDMKQNVGEYIEKHGITDVNRTTLLKDGKKRTVWDEK